MNLFIFYKRTIFAKMEDIFNRMDHLVIKRFGVNWLLDIIRAKHSLKKYIFILTGRSYNTTSNTYFWRSGPGISKSMCISTR
jgi:hypothetical protein